MFSPIPALFPFPSPSRVATPLSNPFFYLGTFYRLNWIMTNRFAIHYRGVSGAIDRKKKPMNEPSICKVANLFHNSCVKIYRFWNCSYKVLL